MSLGIVCLWRLVTVSARMDFFLTLCPSMTDFWRTLLFVFFLKLWDIPRRHLCTCQLSKNLLTLSFCAQPRQCHLSSKQLREFSAKSPSLSVCVNCEVPPSLHLHPGKLVQSSLCWDSHTAAILRGELLHKITINPEGELCLCLDNFIIHALKCVWNWGVEVVGSMEDGLAVSDCQGLILE